LPRVVSSAMLGVLPTVLLLWAGTVHAYYYGGGYSSWGDPCTSCSTDCQAHNAKQAGIDGGQICMEHTYVDQGWGGWPAWCSSSCNVAECDRQGGTCNIDDALFSCVEKDLKVKPLLKPARSSLNQDGSVDVLASFRIGQLKVETTQAPDPTKLTMPFEYTLSWKDVRWSNNRDGLSVNQSLASCRDVLPAALKIPSKIGWIDGYITQAKTEGAYYLPKLKIVNPFGETPPLVSRTVSYDNSNKKVTKVETTLPTFSMADFETDTPYYAFPFDVHTLYSVFEVKPASNIVGCNSSWLMSRDAETTGGIADADGMIALTNISTFGLTELNKILPASGDWNFDYSEAQGPQVALYPGPSSETCVLRIRLRRNPMVYTLKAFVPDLIVMCIAMASLFINPAIPPLFGGRCSILILCILITMNSSLNRNNGLGRLSYLLKIDFVALINLATLLLSMGLSIIVHMAFRFDKLRVGLMLDRAIRMSVPSVIFPGMQLFLYLFLANDSSSGPVTFLIVYLSIAVAVIVSYYVLQFAKETRKLALMSKKLMKLDLKDPKAADILREAFILFDADHSGALDAKEGKKLLRYVNPKLGREQVALAIRAADRSGQGIVEDDFQDMISKWALINDGSGGPDLEEPAPAEPGSAPIVAEGHVEIIRDLKA